MSEQPKSLESQLNMARPRRGEVKRVPLTPEEKEFLGEIMDKAVAAEKAGELAKALEYYQQYKDELLKVKEKKERKKSQDRRKTSKELLNKEEKLKAAKKAFERKPLKVPLDSMVDEAKFIKRESLKSITLADKNGDLVRISKAKNTVDPRIIGFSLSNKTNDTKGFHNLFSTEHNFLIGKSGALYFFLDKYFRLLAEPAQSIVNIDGDIFIERGATISYSPIPKNLKDIPKELQDKFIQKPDGLYWKKGIK